ncbi:MAG: hypothetical protein ACD_36C00147G0001 [uncultured bacterium]|nr:MAG: hypothetical protein ACD_36C00147G0001 [uncultured bacterium]
MGHMPNADSRPGFIQPIQPQDQWTAKLYEKYGFITPPSLEELELKVTQMLEDPLEALSAAEMMLGRRVDAQDKEVTPILFNLGLSGAEKFGLLLIQKTLEANPTGQTAKFKLRK